MVYIEIENSRKVGEVTRCRKILYSILILIKYFYSKNIPKQNIYRSINIKQKLYTCYN